MTSQCAFGGRRVAILGSDGRIVIREKDVLDDIALFQPCGATSIAMNGTYGVSAKYSSLFRYR